MKRSHPDNIYGGSTCECSNCDSVTSNKIVIVTSYLPYVEEMKAIRSIDELEHFIHLLKSVFHRPKPVRLKLSVIARGICESPLVFPLRSVLRLLQMTLQATSRR